MRAALDAMSLNTGKQVEIARPVPCAALARFNRCQSAARMRPDIRDTFLPCDARFSLCSADQWPDSCKATREVTPPLRHPWPFI